MVSEDGRKRPDATPSPAASALPGARAVDPAVDAVTADALTADGLPGASGEFVQSLARGLAVILAFGEQRPRMSLAEVARATGLTRATARRFLLTLEHLGYVRSDGREFALTPRVLDLGFSYLDSLTLPQHIQPHLERLSRAVDESASASVLDGGDIVYVARVPIRVQSVAISVGTRFDATASSMGRVLLAGLPDAQLDAVLDAWRPTRFTPRTTTDRSALRAELERVRAQGWALVDQELEVGLRSLAAPVHRHGAVVAAINVAVSSGRYSVEEIKQVLLPQVLATARAIDGELQRLRTP